METRSKIYRCDSDGAAMVATDITIFLNVKWKSYMNEIMDILQYITMNLYICWSQNNDKLCMKHYQSWTYVKCL